MVKYEYDEIKMHTDSDGIKSGTGKRNENRTILERFLLRVFLSRKRDAILASSTDTQKKLKRNKVT